MIAALAMALDALLGEPKWLWDRAPHPAVLMGRAVAWMDQRFNCGNMRRIDGIATMITLTCCAALIGLVLSCFGPIVEIVTTAILIAHRSLVEHVQTVADHLRYSTEAGRRSVAMIVGRDTREMDGPRIARASIESAAENFSDGIIAPLFWFAIAGLPGLLVYKITNTADSMIGYKTARYHEFGWAAARIDDLLNLIPARLTAALITLAYGLQSQWAAIKRDARLHRSPNAGWPEAAMARVLNVALSGPRSYDGQMQNFPWVNAMGSKTIGPADIDAANIVLWRVWWITFSFFTAIGLICWLV